MYKNNYFLYLQRLLYICKFCLLMWIIVAYNKTVRKNLNLIYILWIRIHRKDL
jgi:hypothetical protein